MGYARLFPDPAKGGRGKTVQRLDFSKQSLSHETGQAGVGET